MPPSFYGSRHDVLPRESTLGLPRFSGRTRPRLATRFRAGSRRRYLEPSPLRPAPWSAGRRSRSAGNSSRPQARARSPDRKLHSRRRGAATVGAPCRCWWRPSSGSACGSGERPRLEAYRERFPEHREIVDAVFAGAVGPERIGAFGVLRFLGAGSFGMVYLCRDEQLDRLVAIKVPRSDRFSGPRRRRPLPAGSPARPPGSSTPASSRSFRSIAIRPSAVSSSWNTSRADRSPRT